MALNLRVEPIVCLEWVTEAPCALGSRQSPDFAFLQNDCYLEMKLNNDNDLFFVNRCKFCCEIWLNPRLRPCTSRPNYFPVVDAQLTVKGKSYTQREDLGNKTLPIRILKISLSEQDISPSECVETWQVICKFRAKETCTSFSVQVGNKAVSLSSDNSSVDECVQVSQEVPLDMKALSSDISGLLEEEILPDFKLNCGDRSFQVHRSVLAARSEVFRRMFENPMQESETGFADIKDLEEPVVESLLKFFYSGQLEDLSEDNAAGLYEIADKYAVRSLRKACSYWMERNLSEDNCISYLSMADSHSDPELRASVISFIVKHPGLFKSAAWLTFSKQRPVLAVEVLQAYF